MKNFPSRYEGISARLRYIIEYEVPVKGRIGWLEEQTGIPRGTWQTFLRRTDATPGGDMVQAVARLFPRYAFWLASGLTDQDFGHTYPRHQGSKCFPELPAHEDQKRFDDYFSHCMNLQMNVYGSGVVLMEEEQRASDERLKELKRLRRNEIEMLRIEEENRATEQRIKTQKSLTRATD